MADAPSRNPPLGAGEGLQDTFDTVTASEVLSEDFYPTREGWIEAQMEDEFLARVYRFVLAQELPDDVCVRKQILDAAQDCVLDRGLLMRYLQPDSLVDADLDGCLKILVPKNLRMQLIQQFHDPPLVGHLGNAKTYKRVRSGHY